MNQSTELPLCAGSRAGASSGALALQIESSLCQESVRGRVEAGRLSMGVALWLVREWLFRSAGVQGLPATLDSESFPGCPPGPLSVGGVSDELAVDGVADPSFQCA